VGLPLEALSWLLVNEVEGAFLAGTEAPEAILDTLAARYPETTVVLTLGEQGAAAALSFWAVVRLGDAHIAECLRVREQVRALLTAPSSSEIP
jgi:sugar/nucleoside kinase (ribokinase family)